MATMVKQKYREKKKPKESAIASKAVNVSSCDVENVIVVKKSVPIEQVETIQNIEKPTELISETRNQEVIVSESSFLVDRHTSQNFEYATEDSGHVQEVIESEISPSAPPLTSNVYPDEILSEKTIQQTNTPENIVKESAVQFMSLEEAERLFGGAEIAEVRLQSEHEKSLVETGSGITASHPLVDLLTTFRRSLLAVETERVELARGYAQEENLRLGLWKTEKRNISMNKTCELCAETVWFKSSYVHATFYKEKVPAARMRLEMLLRNVQQSYCHYQHEALYTHWQIEDLIYSVIQNNNSQVRQALDLLLQALRTTDSASSALSMALQRWARALTVRLLRDGHVTDLLFVLHHLFRQTRSVYWASRLVSLTIGDMSDAARVVTLLDVLLSTAPHFLPDTAMECKEEFEDAWEEVDKYGAVGAVSDGAMRERDLLALLYRLPLRNLLARLAVIRRQDIENITEYEWGDASGGHAVLKCVCGVRYLLSVLLRGTQNHLRYTRLIRALAKVGLYSLNGLADLNTHCSLQYAVHLMLTIEAEMEACALLGWKLLSITKVRLHRLPFVLLTSRTAKIICEAITEKLHGSTSIPSVGLDCDLDCSSRVRIVARMAIDRIYDFELAAFVIKFLIPLALSRKSPPCADQCETTARNWMPRLLATHTHLYQSAFHIFADQYKIDSSAVSYIECVSPSGWRPSVQEAINVLDEWSERCPTLLPHMLLTLDCTPFSGLSFDTQLSIGEWLSHYVQDNGDTPEWAWKVLRRLRLHRTWWKTGLEVPPPREEPKDIFGTAHALLATGWGHTIPLICEFGVAALARLVEGGRARDAAHCLARIMLVMTQSPESIAYTPKFGVVRTSLLGTGPSLMQRALGLGGTPGAAILTKLLTQQLTVTYKELAQRSPRDLLLVWLQFLAPPNELSPSVAPFLEVALVCCRKSPEALQAFDDHLCQLVQDENIRGHFKTILRNPAVAPALCEAILRAEHTERELRSALWPRLLDAIYNQKRASRKIHVDNALKSIIQHRCSADDLVIYKIAAVVLLAPMSHLAQVALWKLFIHLYLQRPPSFMHESTPPVGSLLFSGIIKSRILGQLKKRLLETLNYHRIQAEKLKQQGNDNNAQTSAPKKTITISKVQNEVTDLLPPLTIDNLIGESDSDCSSESEQSDSEEELVPRSKSLTPNDEVLARTKTHLITYHEGVQKALRDFLQWLEEDDKTRVLAHYADLSRYITQPALETAWNTEIEGYTLMLSANEEDVQHTQKTRFERLDSKTPLQRIVSRLTRLHYKNIRSTAPQLQQPLEGVDLKKASDVLSIIDQLLKDIIQFSNEWGAEVTHVSLLDDALWQYVAALRERRVLSPVTLTCTKKCKPIIIVPPEAEWCTSPGAERAVAENRASARGALRRLARPRPHAARGAASLQALTRAVRESSVALSALEYAWRCAALTQLEHCLPAKSALISFATSLAQSWICNNSERCTYLISRWCNQQLTPLQLCLSGVLIEPRCLPPSGLSLTYRAILKTRLPPDTIFSWLSKFEMSSWATNATTEQRREVIDAILETVLRFGPEPPPENSMLIELLDVHLHALINIFNLPAHAARCSRYVAEGKWPRVLWRHLLRSVEKHASTMNSDSICSMLRDLGVIWWETRTKGLFDVTAQEQYTKHVTQIARLYRTCAKAVVASMLNAHTTTELAAWYAWSASSEAWAPWSLPHTSSPLLQSTGEQAEKSAHMLREFVETVVEVLNACPGGELRVLQEAWLWCCNACVAMAGVKQPESRIQLHSLCAEMLRLPWANHKWFHVRCINSAIQLCSFPEEEKIWISNVLKSVDASGWLEGVPDVNFTAHLAAVLYIANSLPLREETLQEMMHLPWERLPLSALEVELHRFFFENVCHTAYHSIPCFKVLVSASEIYKSPNASGSQREKRLAFITHWVRACASPQTLAGHLADSAAAMLKMCDAVYGDIEKKNECADQQIHEAQEFLCRAIALLDSEPGSSMALSAWVQWCPGAPSHLTEVALSAAATLTAREAFASLAEALLQAYLTTVTGNWSTVCHRWSSCCWHEASWLAARARLLTAYGASLSTKVTPKQLQETFLALAQIKLNFNEQEAAAALWICRAARAVRESEQEVLKNENSTVMAAGRSIVGAAAEALLAAWAEPPTVRASFLRAFSLGSTDDRPSAKLRALSRYAQCVLAGSSEDTVKAVEQALSSALGSKVSEFTPWTKNLQPKMLPALAQRFYTKHRRYFDIELQLAPGDDVVVAHNA